MPTLNMDMDIANQAVRRMETSYTTITDEIRKIRGQIYTNLQDNGNWMGFSANEFFKVFNAIDLAFDKRLEDFRMLGDSLHQEVDQWISMQEHLSDLNTNL